MKEKGFTLIEVLIAIALFVISILLLFQLVLLAMRTNLINAKRNDAIMTAFVESEKVKTTRFEDITDEFTTVYRNGTFYFVQKRVSVLPDKPELKEVRVGVYWGMEYGGLHTSHLRFDACMQQHQNIEECKNIAHHSYEYTFLIAEAL